MWAHYCYLLLLPAVAVVAALKMGLSFELAEALVIAGIGPRIMYALFLANGYTLPNSLPVALVVTLAVPVQIALSVLLFGGRSVWLFFAEDATVEIGAFVLGMLYTALLNIRRKSGWTAFILMSIMTFALIGSGTIPYFLMVWRGYGGLSLWLLLFITSFATAFKGYAQLYERVIERHRRTGEFQEVEVKFDGGFVTKLLGINSEAEVISPFQGRYQKSGLHKRPLLLSLLCFILPIVTLIVLEIGKK